MKTQNAFALKDFDGEKFLQLNFFFNRLGLVHDDTDANILDFYDVRNIAYLGSAEMVDRLSYLQKLKVAVAAYTKSLELNTNRLEVLSTSYAKKFAETAVQMWQDKYRGANNCLQEYRNNIVSLCNLQKKIEELERVGEKAIDDQRRKEFSIRLKKARQKAKLKQSDVALKLKVTPATIASYEQAISAPQIPMLIRIAQALNASTDELLGLK